MTLRADDRALRVAELINEARAEEGHEHLKVEVHLNDAARVQSEHMNSINDISHEGPWGNSVIDRAQEADFDFSGTWRVTENVGFLQGPEDFSDADLIHMHNAFMDSEGHYANIMDPDVNYIGVHVHEGSMPVFEGIEIPTLYFTMKFATTQGDAVVQDPETGDLMLYTAGEFVDFVEESEADIEEPSQDEPLSAGPILPEDDRDRDHREQEKREEEDRSVDTVGCFIATAAFGNSKHPDVLALRRYRDLVLTRSRIGSRIIICYQTVGPIAARFVQPDHRIARVLRAILRLAARLLDPGVRIKL